MEMTMTNFQWALRAPYQPSTFGLLGAAIVAGFRQVARVLKNRRDAGLLAELDDRMLRDIGLTRSDVRDAFSEPLWRDPTDILVRRAGERRTSRQMAAAVNALYSVESPSLTPEQGYARPAMNRPARYTV
jgi:uncharacterized protein YjiS (DUF1127 family)